MQWYYADGPLQNSGARWSGTLFMFDFGQPLNGVYTAPVNVGSAGTMTIDFSSRSRGIITWPGGRTSSIERYNFGVGQPPNGLLGDWIYVYTVGTSTFAERYLYTTILAATSSGNGVVSTSNGSGGAELQVTGPLAGTVVAVQVSSTGTVLNSYTYTPHLEEGRGFWIAPVTNNTYGMNAYRIGSPSGINKREQPGGNVDERARLAGAAPTEAKGMTIEDIAAVDPDRAAVIAEIRDRLMAHRLATQ